MLDAPQQEDAPLQVAHGVWGALSRLPEPALLFSGKKFQVLALNPAAQAFFDNMVADRVTKCLETSLSKLLIERVCLAARTGSGAYVSELPAQLTMGDNAVRVTRLTVLPMASPEEGPQLAVLYVRKMPEEQPVTNSYAKLPRELLSWLPMPAWLVDANNAVPYQNPACRDLPMVAVNGPLGLDLTAVLNESDRDELQVEEDYAQALRLTSRNAREHRRIADSMVTTGGQVWRIVHLPIVGVDAKPYLLGLAIRLSKDLGGVKVDINLGDVSEQDTRRKLQARARERERIKLAREVHDSLGQELTVLRLGMDRLFDTVREELPVTPAHNEQFALLKRQMKQVINSSRQIAYQLRHDLVQSAGLMHAVENLVAQFREKLSIPGQLEVGPGWADPTSVLASNIYRSAQELLNNMAKHAQANRFLVRLKHSDGDYSLEVIDDGVGFAQNRRSSSLGLSTMKERVEYHKGSMAVQTRPQVAGSHITLTFMGENVTGFPDTNY